MAGKKILIVEDEAVQLTSVARRLKSAGYEVVGARDGASAISTARKELPDLVLLDLGLPAGDGFTALKRLQMLIQTTTIPVIVVSARSRRQSRRRAQGWSRRLSSKAAGDRRSPQSHRRCPRQLLNPTHLPTPPEPRPEAEGSAFSH